MEEIKKVVEAILSNFLKEEQGNRVTSNNMLALSVHINGALDGKITITPPNKKEEGDADSKE
jgi:hypothetical protein